MHLSFKSFMCGMKDSLRSKTTPRNLLVSSTTGTGVPFSSKVGSFAQFTEVYAYGFRGRELESIGVSPVCKFIETQITNINMKTLKLLIKASFFNKINDFMCFNIIK